jgi:hypothetical protein
MQVQYDIVAVNLQPTSTAQSLSPNVTGEILARSIKDGGSKA